MAWYGITFTSYILRTAGNSVLSDVANNLLYYSPDSQRQMIHTIWINSFDSITSIGTVSITIIRITQFVGFLSVVLISLIWIPFVIEWPNIQTVLVLRFQYPFSSDCCFPISSLHINANTSEIMYTKQTTNNYICPIHTSNSSRISTPSHSSPKIHWLFCCFVLFSCFVVVLLL
jgi:hypothetical protein